MTCVINLPTHFSNWQGSVFQPKTITVRYNDKPWFTSEIRKKIRIRDRLRKEILINHRNKDISKYAKKTEKHG
jgi:hypothetical protein